MLAFILQAAPVLGNPAAVPASPVSRLITAVSRMLPLVIDEVEGAVQKPLMQLCFIVAAIMVYLTIWKMMSYINKVEFDQMIWFFVRTVALIILVAYSAMVVNKLEMMGQAIGSFTPIQTSLNNQRAAFDGSFRSMTKHYFQVEPGSIGSVEAVMGALREAPITTMEDIIREDDPDSLKRMFAALNLGRGLLEFSNIFLLVMTEWILLAFRLAGPLMAAMAIDPDTRKKMSIPFLWSVLIFTLITPLMSQIIRIIVYAMANMAIRGLDTENYLFVYDPQMSAIMMRDATGGSPVYAALFGGIGMALAGLVLMASPYLSYKLMQGQIFEAVSSTLSGWIAGFTGGALEYAGIRASTTIQKQAEQQQAHGQYESASTLAEAQKRVADIQSLMGKNSGQSQAEAARAGGIAQTQGAFTATSMMANANYEAAKNTFFANKDSQVSQIGTGKEKETTGMGIQKDKDLWASHTQEGKEGQNVGASVMKGTIGSLGGGGEAGSAIPLLGGVASGVAGIMNIGTTMRTANDGRDNIRSTTEANQLNIQVAAEKNMRNQEGYAARMEGIEGTRRNASLEAAASQRNASMGGINSSYGIQMANARSNYGLSLNANQISQTAQMKSASILQDTSIKTANERAVAQLIATMSRDISRRLETGITMRF